MTMSSVLGLRSLDCKVSHVHPYQLVHNLNLLLKGMAFKTCNDLFKLVNWSNSTDLSLQAQANCATNLGGFSLAQPLVIP